MSNRQALSRRGQFFLLALFPIYFIIAGLFLQPLDEILPGLLALIREPDFLITDYLVVGGTGAAFLNAGVLALLSVALLYSLGLDLDGHAVTSVCLMFGFSLFGKNLVNIWAVLAGVWLYSQYHRTPFSRYVYIGLYGTSLSPIITQMMQIGHLPVPVRLLLAIGSGVVIGFVLPPLATHAHYAHKGYSLYNVGFAAGIIATVAVSLLRSFDIDIESRLIWHTGSNGLFFALLALLFAGMSLGALWWGGARSVLSAYQALLRTPGLGGTDYLREQGGAATLFNMGVNGLLACALVVLVGADLNGPTIGSIFTIVGFSATGKHLRNILPVMLGVFVASLTKNWDINQPAPILAFLLSTTLAPIAGEFGWLAGIVAGFLHSSVALNVGIVYGGMNLYNNGFAGGLIAMFLVPVIQSIRSRKARAKEEVSL